MGGRALIVLDTHAWIWWVNEPERLSNRARAAVRYSRRVGICPISAWEISMKVARGRLQLDRDPEVWVRQALSLRGVESLELTPEIAVAAGRLGGVFHGDRADRLIVATAMRHGAELVTKDRRIRSYAAVRTVW